MRITEIEVIEITHTCCLLAAKVRERDIYCPMVSMIVKAGGSIIHPSVIKRREIEISHFFDWNIAMMTFYDYLEQFLVMGTVLAQDQVRVSEDRNLEDDMYRSPEVRKPEQNIEAEEYFVSPTNSDGSPSKDKK